VAPGHWPQWRGPARDGVSTEEHLLHEWPQGGPPLLWKAKGLGEGIGCISVAGGLIFAQGNQADKDTVTALDGLGRIVWSVPIGPASGERGLMRYVTQRSPSVDDGLLFVTTWQGMICCLESTTGRIFWRKGYKEDLGASTPSWAFGDAPLVEEKVVICTPGGANGSLAALDKMTGEVIWRSAHLTDMIHAAIVPTQIGPVRQYVAFTYNHVAGISAKTGAVLWKADRSGKTAVVSAPVVHDGGVFVSSGFGVGGNGFQVKEKDGVFSVTELYQSRELANNHGGFVRVGAHVYGTIDRGALQCFELSTGKVVWQALCVGKGCISSGDGMLIVRGEQGTLALVEATPEGYRERGRFDLPERTSDYPHTHPVIAGGRLYIRDQNTLWCYLVARFDYKVPDPVWNLVPRIGKRVPPGKPAVAPAEGRTPDAAFVPTPQDVVDKMIEMADVKKKDVLYDLGSGDGRILFAASINRGCKSVGFEINPALVWESRFKAKEAKLEALVTTEEKDLFTVDLEPATVVMLYLGESNNAKLLSKFRKLKPGVRIVSHAHLLGEDGPRPDQEVRMRSKEDQEVHTIYLWTTPLGEGKR
jgi:outer membrane protein assembly factor BamB